MYILDLIFIAVIGTLVGFLIGMSGKPKNKVHFYVARDKDNSLWLYLGKVTRSEQIFMSTSYGRIIISEKYFSKYGLDVNNYANLKWEDEPVEVFLNLEE